MKADEIRLECLKLANTRAAETAQVLERAALYEAFVAGNPPAAPAKPATR